MKKILITGTSGFVGSRVAKALQDRYELLTPSHQECDITRGEAVEAYVRMHRPDAILHLAAISNTGYCEQHPEESMVVNVQGVIHMAEAAQRYGCKLVWFSSDQVYNGNLELGPLSEDIAVCPENHYGRHKLLAEKEALRCCPESVALRATWMYDIRREGMPTHNNFVLNVEEALRQHTPLRMATREYRGITWVDEVVRNIPHTLDLPGGVYNFGAENDFNTYDTARAYLDAMGCATPDIIVPDNERFAEHVRNISISIRKVTEASDGAIRFASTVEGLNRFSRLHQKVRYRAD
jgi:dTDP-4-dehydrorhamnose reductase